MKIEVYVVNAFTLDEKGGNPAGIVFDFENRLSEIEMQLIAKKMALSETAFIRYGTHEVDFDLRFFTPTDEVPLCGHATIASFWLMTLQKRLSKSELLQKTPAGILNLSVDTTDNLTTVWMTQSDPQCIKSNLDFDAQFKAAFPSAMIDSKLPIEIWSTGLHDILLPIKSRDALNQLQIDMTALSTLSKDLNVVGVHAFVSSNDSQLIYARNFAPLYGIDEESATGTSNGALTAYLAHHYNISQCHKNQDHMKDSYTYKVLQGEMMESPSLIFTRLDYTDSIKEPIIWVGGTCSLNTVTTIEI